MRRKERNHCAVKQKREKPPNVPRRQFEKNIFFDVSFLLPQSLIYKSLTLLKYALILWSAYTFLMYGLDSRAKKTMKAERENWRPESWDKRQKLLHGDTESHQWFLATAAQSSGCTSTLIAIIPFAAAHFLHVCCRVFVELCIGGARKQLPHPVHHSTEGRGARVAAQNKPKLLKQQRLWAQRVPGLCPVMRGRVSVSLSGACVHWASPCFEWRRE